MKSAAVTTNDPATPQVNLTIAFKAVQLVTLQPDRIFNPNLMVGEKTPLPPLALTAEDPAKPLVNPSLGSTPPGLAGKLIPIREGFEYRIDLWYDGSGPPGKVLDGAIELKTGWDEPAVSQIPYTLLVVGPIRALPDRIDWGDLLRDQWLSAPERYQMRVVVTYPGGTRKQLKLGKPVSSTKFVKVTSFIEQIPGQQYELLVDLSPETPVGELTGTLSMTTPDRRMKRLEIPVHVRLK